MDELKYRLSSAVVKVNYDCGLKLPIIVRSVL